MLIASLIYEGLFEIDENFEAHPVLCESCETEDGQTWKFIIKSVTCHDGSTLKPSDVAYSISRAKSSDKYSARLSCVSSIGYDDTVNELTIILSYPNYDLPKLLDVPIAAYGSFGTDDPIGTGPYYLDSSGLSLRLTAFDGYRDRDSLPIDHIYLEEYGSEEIVSAFETHELDLITQDPCGTAEYSFGGSYETRYYDTTVMQYIGFNVNNTVLQDPQIRLAISYGIDRETIAQDVFSNHATPAYLAVGVNAFGYNASLAEKYKYSKQKLTDIFVSLGMEDSNSDGYLEYPVYGTDTAFTIDFIVNSDNRYKVEAAEQIAAALKNAGLNVNLRTLSWSAYKAALESGNFDMYYGEVKLSPDFDLTEILAGDLNYGGIYDSEYLTLIRALKATAPDETDEEDDDVYDPDKVEPDTGGDSDPDAVSREDAAYALYSYIAERAPIIPIVFKQSAVLTHRGVVTGIDPVQSNVFYGITNWEINLD
jgi:peptide/nickel transport system substrate-binding protein